MMNPQEANYAYLRGEVELVSLRDAEGRIAAEGALPYPPGCCAWFRGSLGRFRAALLRRAGRRDQSAAGLCAGVTGVYVEECDGRKQVRCYVIKQPAAQPSLLKGEKL